MCSSGCGVKKCAQHQITSYVQPCNSDSVIRLTVHSAYKNMPQFVNVRHIMLGYKRAAKSALLQKFIDTCTSPRDSLASFLMVFLHRTYVQDDQDLPGSSATINDLLAKKSLKAQSCVNFKSFIFCFQFGRL